MTMKGGLVWDTARWPWIFKHTISWMKLGSLPKWIHLDCNTINSTLLRVLDIALDMAGFKQQVIEITYWVPCGHWPKEFLIVEISTPSEDGKEEEQEGREKQDRRRWEKKKKRTCIRLQSPCCNHWVRDSSRWMKLLWHSAFALKLAYRSMIYLLVFSSKMFH